MEVPATYCCYAPSNRSQQLQASGHNGVGKEGTEARDHPASPSPQVWCWDLLSQRLSL